MARGDISSAASAICGETRGFKHFQCWISELVASDERSKISSTPSGNCPARAEPKSFKSVCVMGVIVGVVPAPDLVEADRPIGYLLDDGTGVIKVAHFLRKRLQFQQRLGATARLDAVRNSDLQVAGIPSDDHQTRESFGRLLAETSWRLETSKSVLSVGECVEVRGKLQRFRDQNEILAESVAVVTDPALEIERNLRIERLRREGVYSREFL